MDAAQLQKSIDAVSQNVEGLLATMGKREEKDAALTEQLSTLQTSLKETDDWCREIEALATKRAESGYSGGNALLEAIPAADRRECAIAEMYGTGNRAESIAKAARALWLQKTIQREGVKDRPEHYARLSKEIATLEQGFGAGLVSQAAQGETTTGTGPELILTPVEAEVLRQIKDNSYIRQVARLMPMVSKTHQIPSLDTDVIAFFTAEGGTITDSMSATNWSQKALTAKKIAGLANISSELLQDSAIGLSDFLFGAIAEQIGRLEDTEALEGTGTNFTGVNAASGVLTIAATTDGSALTYKAGVVAAIFKCADVDSRQNAAWFMSPAGAVEAFGLTDTNGQPIFQLPNASMITTMPQGARGMLMGYPAFVHSGIKSDRTKGVGTALTNIYFGNWKKLIIGDRLGLTFATDPYSLFTTDTVRVRVVKRTGCVVGVPKSFVVVKDRTTS